MAGAARQRGRKAGSGGMQQAPLQAAAPQGQLSACKVPPWKPCPRTARAPKDPGGWACSAPELRPPVSPSHPARGSGFRRKAGGAPELPSSPDPTAAFSQGPPTPRAPSAQSMGSDVSLEILFVQCAKSRSGLWPSPLLPGWLTSSSGLNLVPYFSFFCSFQRVPGKETE